jgi:hypothetical protein
VQSRSQCTSSGLSDQGKTIMIKLSFANRYFQNNQKYAFLCAFLSFLSLFSAVIHVEIGTTSNITFIIVFVIVGKLLRFIIIISNYVLLLLPNQHVKWNLLALDDKKSRVKKKSQNITKLYLLLV